MFVIDVLGQLNEGNTLQDLENALKQVAQDVQLVRKAGSVTLTIAVEPSGKRDDIIFLTDKLSVKRPESNRESSIWFVGEDGELERQDPRQKDMFDKEKK